MQFIADLHIHSRYARATSRELNLENLHKWAALKGITVVGTGISRTRPGSQSCRRNWSRPRRVCTDSKTHGGRPSSKNCHHLPQRGALSALGGDQLDL